MPAHDAILQKMRAAQIPPHAYDQSLRIARQVALATIFANKEYDHGPAGVVSYVVERPSRPRADMPSISKVCAIAAKELVLARKSVYYTTIPELIIGQRMYERGVESIFSLADRIGDGYIVIGDIGINTRDRSVTEWQDVQSVLLSHLSRGGGLLLGLTDPEQAVFEQDMLDAMSMFTRITVA